MNRLGKLFLVYWCLAASASFAHIPSAGWLVAQAAGKNRHQYGKGIRIYSLLKQSNVKESFSDDKKNNEDQVRETWIVGADGRSRREVQKARHLGVGLGLESIPSQGEKLLSEAEFLFSLLVSTQLDLEEANYHVNRTLSISGLDSNVVSIQRFGRDRFAYVIGAQPWEKEKPQLWLDKETSFPLREIHTRGQGPDKRLVDIQFRNWKKTGSAGFYMPETIEHYEDKRLIQTWDILGVSKDRIEIPRHLNAKRR